MDGTENGTDDRAVDTHDERLAVSGLARVIGHISAYGEVILAMYEVLHSREAVQLCNTHNADLRPIQPVIPLSDEAEEAIEIAREVTAEALAIHKLQKAGAAGVKAGSLKQRVKPPAGGRSGQVLMRVAGRTRWVDPAAADEAGNPADEVYEENKRVRRLHRSITRKQIALAMRLTGGNIKEAAFELGLPRSTLSDRLRRYKMRGRKNATCKARR